MKLADKIFQRTDYRTTSPFGMRMHPVEKVLKMHNGTDYADAVKGKRQNLYAPEDGKVLRRGFDKGAGNYVVLDIPRIGKQLHLFHLSSIAVKAGQAVKAGELLGVTGDTGNTDGVHLHLGMKPSAGGAWEDPHAYIYTPSPATRPARPAQRPQGRPGRSEDIQKGDRVRVVQHGVPYTTGAIDIPEWLTRRGPIEVRQVGEKGGKPAVLLGDGIVTWILQEFVEKVED